MTKQYNVDYFQDRKLKYEKNHGVFIHEFMFTEFSNRILGQCNVALNDLQHQLDLEITRAKAEEKRIEAKAYEDLELVYSVTNLTGKPFKELMEGDLFPASEIPKIENDGKNLTLSNQPSYYMQPAIIDSFTNLVNYLKLFGPTNFPYASYNSNTNNINTTEPINSNKNLAKSLRDSYVAISQSIYEINDLYMVDKADCYTLNDQGRLVKIDQQTKLISNYNNTLMNISQALNRLAKKVEDLENK